MPKPNDPGGFEPTAPPIHMMPQHYTQPVDERELRDRSPPPRYEEAIAEDWPASSSPQPPPPVPAHQPNPVRIPLSPHRRTGEPANRQHTRTRQADYGRPSSCNSSRISTPAHTPEHNPTDQGQGARRSRSNNLRYRSASPGELSDGDECNATSARNASGNRARRTRAVAAADKKRGSGSKIKKGLENIAFFIIQILD